MAGSEEQEKRVESRRDDRTFNQIVPTGLFIYVATCSQRFIAGLLSKSPVGTSQQFLRLFLLRNDCILDCLPRFLSAFGSLLAYRLSSLSSLFANCLSALCGLLSDRLSAFAYFLSALFTFING